jgi:hypothetical protein|tara:strand:- start:184 stop:351 length:168 start_codon:yes stop_codon:yes gene_type:complete
MKQRKTVARKLPLVYRKLLIIASKTLRHEEYVNEELAEIAETFVNIRELNLDTPL